MISSRYDAVEPINEKLDKVIASLKNFLKEDFPRNYQI